MKRLSVNTAWCKGCGICVEFCPVGVFTQEKDGTPVPSHQEKCTGCKLCVLRCPDFAIKLEVTADEQR